jgi:hypothetical protein
VTDFDVTPVGRAPGAGAAGGSGARGDGSDPFGSLPSVRRRGWVRIVLGVACLVAGVVATVVGIAQTAEKGDKITADAVARGVLAATDGAAGPPVRFAVPAGGERSYTVYLLFDPDNVVNREREEAAAVRDSRCQVRLPNERVVAFGGNAQGVSNSIGRATTVGSFSSPAGGVEVRCAYGEGTYRSRIQRPDRVPYVVTPGSPDGFGGGSGLVLAGVTVAIAGGFLAGWGWRGSRRRV